MNIKEILAQMCLSEQAEATPFKSAEDGTDYAVWKINDGNTAYVLKKASEQELSVYNTFLASAERAVPHLYKSLNYCGELFFAYGIHRRARPAEVRPRIADCGS